MVTLNLLPWRLQKKMLEKKRLRLILLLTPIFTVLLLVGCYVILMIQQETLQNKLNELEDKQLTDTDIKETDNLAVAQQITQMIHNQKIMMSILNQPAVHVCFTSIKQDKNKFVFAGRTPSALAFTIFMTQWPSAQLFAELKIEKLNKPANHHDMDFSFYGELI